MPRLPSWLSLSPPAGQQVTATRRMPAGWHANATLVTTLGEITDPAQRIRDFSIRLRADITPQTWKATLNGIDERMCLPAHRRQSPGRAEVFVAGH